jgi:hypothetical protein
MPGLLLLICMVSDCCRSRYVDQIGAAPQPQLAPQFAHLGQGVSPAEACPSEARTGLGQGYASAQEQGW